MISQLRRVACAVLAAGALIASSCVVRAQPSTQTISHYGVEFPATFADGTRISMHDFEPAHPGLGFSAGYRHRGAISTIYIYNLRLPAIPDDLRAEVVKRQFEQAKSDIRKTQLQGATVDSKGTFMIKDARGRPRLQCEGFVLKRHSADAPRDSYLCLGVAKGKFFKVRTTMPQHSNSQAEIHRFIGAWGAVIWK